ncbi:MAG: flagellar basal body L-ring protein FlgH [Chromatiaceae bacterium]|nr:flagellar basal body L-ring protein FlgH [Chromatiaceae bacterium]MCP5421495.1 flagellar basal body L-ring protein FlgH [Chromatiaceae bacterium]
MIDRNCKSLNLCSAAIRVVIVLGVLVLLAGCNSTPKRDPEYAAVPPESIPPVPRGNGSIFQAGFERAWFENIRARRIGDILLVNLVEDTEASHTNSGTVEKANSTSITNPTLFGNNFSFKVPGRSTSFNLNQGLESDTSFSGDADNTQNNQFNGSVTVMVTEVLPNGYLRVRGEKRIGMTGGNEYIRVSGIVRPEDIDTRNTVESTRVADATLVYVGDGQVSKATTMGWLAKFFISAIMPF